MDYSKVFKPETLATLKGKSGESLRRMWGDKTLRQAMMSNMQLLYQLIELESDHREELEMIAVQIVKDMYPVVDYAGIEIDAKIVDQGEIDLDMGGDKVDGFDEVPGSVKRRIINGITQGSSVRGPYAYLMFQDHLNEINPELVDNYRELLNVTFGVFDSDEAISMMLGMLSQGQKMEGGSSEVKFDAETGELKVIARGLCFPYLVHEIIKGLHEIVSLQGFSGDKEKNKQIVQHVDRLSNEPEDTRYGKFIYDALNELYMESNIDDPRVRELFLAELYKMEDGEFIEFIENLLNDKLTSFQKKWALDEMYYIQKDLNKDDTGLSGLD